MKRSVIRPILSFVFLGLALACLAKGLVTKHEVILVTEEKPPAEFMPPRDPFAPPGFPGNEGFELPPMIVRTPMMVSDAQVVLNATHGNIHRNDDGELVFIIDPSKVSGKPACPT